MFKFRHSVLKRVAGLVSPVVLLLCGLTMLLRAEHLPIKTYTVADGLLQDTVHKIKQDSRGFLWFCTGEGVSRFDGYAFTNFTEADGLPQGGVNDILETRSGTIYIATNSGLAQLNPSGIRIALKDNQNPSPDALFTLFQPDNPKAKVINVLYEDRDGTVWVGTSDGLYKLNSSNKLEAINLGESKAPEKQIIVTAIIKDRRETLWMSTEGGGLFRLAANSQASQFTDADGLPGNNVASLMEDSEGNVWAGMRLPANAGLILLNPDAPEKPIVRRAFSESDGLPSHWIPAMYQSSDGKLWLATIAGLCQWQGADAKSVCRTYRAENDLCDKDVWGITEDKDGNLWTGSECGAKKWAHYGFTAYGEPDGIKAMPISSIFENRSGELFATIRYKGTHLIYRFNADSKFTGISPNLPPETNYFSWGWKQTVWEDSTNAWLVPTSFGLFKFSPETKFESLASSTPQKFSNGNKGTDVFRVFEDSHGDIWMATTFGVNELWRWERRAKVWHNYTEQLIPAPHRLVSAFVEDKSGNLWIGTGADEGSELIRYRNGQFKTFTEKDNLPNGWIRDLYIDRENRLWIANSRNGLLRIDDVDADQLNLIRYSTIDGLSSAGVYCVTEDKFGRIYVGSARGIDRLHPATEQVENFTTTDGLPASHTEVAYRDRNDNLWFGTTKGLTKFVPEPERNRRPPEVLITALRVNGEPQAISILGETEIPNRDFNSEQKQVSVDFVGLGASLGEKLRYEYRLGDADWTPTSERTVNFANLSAGDYKFEVRTVTADRLYSLKPAVMSFHIAAPFYQRSWFLILATAFVILVVFSLYRYRLNKLLELERTRTRIATDLHDDIGTNLSKISLLSEIVNLQLAEQNTESHHLLKSIAEISRESVGSMSDIVWAINPKRDSAFELISRMRLHTEEIFLDKNVRIRFDTSESIESLKLSMNVRRELFLIFKEAVNNAARHSGCQNIEIDFRLENGTIFLQISDDGKGFDTLNKTDGNGLGNMRSRAEKNGGNFTVESKADHGTILNIQFPQN